eukprot:UN33617
MANEASNWKEYLDEASGREYYANIVTNETTWEKPQCMIDLEEANVPIQNIQSPPVDDASEWEKWMDDDTGREYWYNKSTQETTWENPYEVEAEEEEEDEQIQEQSEISRSRFELRSEIIPDLPESPGAGGVQNYEEPIQYNEPGSMQNAQASYVTGTSSQDYGEEAEEESNPDEVKVEDLGGKWRKVLAPDGN